MRRSAHNGMLLGLALMVVAVWAPPVAAGAGGTYTVVQCHTQNRGHADARVNEPRPYSIGTACSNASSEHAIQINSRLYAKANRAGTVRWVAPPGTALVGVRVQAKLRRARGHYSRLYMADGRGRQTVRVATGDNSPSPFRVRNWKGSGQRQFVAALGCTRVAGCAASPVAKAWLRQVRLTVADLVDPGVVEMGGSLLSSGWKRGEHSLTGVGSDEGSGVSEIVLRINGVEIAKRAGTCPGSIPHTSTATRLRPCSEDRLRETVVRSTSQAPFENGNNTVSFCSRDFAGNQSCGQREVRVDNTEPSLSFSSSQDPEDPELIQANATDGHSGVAEGRIYFRAEGQALWQPLDTAVADGALRARVDSTAVAPGTYEFRAVATDTAGNTAETTRRTDGLAMRLAFPLKAGVKLNARLEPGGGQQLTIPYGKRSRVAGLLREASGDPLPGQEIVIEEYFGDGALIRERISRVRTDENGRWQERLPAGPSRRVTVHYAGTPRYLSKSTLGGRLAVRTRASLRTSKRRVLEGNRVVFRGRLGRLGARIPSGGKLLELQVKQDRHTYQTVGQGFRSKPSGRYRVPYRFGRFYQYDVRFRFRIKVAREADWPYKAPIRSRARVVKVLDR